MPYWIAVGALGVLFVILIIALISNRQLIPGIVILGSFILFVLFLTGLVKISIELFGPSGGVNGNCQQYVQNQEFKGQSINTLAWLQQNNICKSDVLRLLHCSAVDTQIHRLVLEGRLQFRSDRDCVLAMDDDHGMAGSE